MHKHYNKFNMDHHDDRSKISGNIISSYNIFSIKQISPVEISPLFEFECKAGDKKAWGL